MLDLNVAIFTLLKPVAKVELEFPDTGKSFPIITIAEISNLPDLIVEGKEKISDITYQVDVWDNGKDRQTCERIANEVSHVLIQNHFERIMARGFKDPSGLHRKTMYFNTKAINL